MAKKSAVWTFGPALAALTLCAALAGAQTTTHFEVERSSDTGETDSAPEAVIDAPEDEPAQAPAPAPAPTARPRAAGARATGGGAASAPAPAAKPAARAANAEEKALQSTEGPCQYNGVAACELCLVYWSGQGNEQNNHFCKDKSRANGTKGWDCFNYVEDTSNGYECISYCPPGTPTCKDHCDQKTGGQPYHDHPLRRTQNRHTGRIMGPPGSAPEKNKGLESRDKCNW